MTKKPKWVEALEAAEGILKRAESTTDPAEQGSLNGLAHTWLDISRLYQDNGQ